MKMIKKITISAIVLVLAFFFAFTVNVNADGTPVTSEYIEVKGASVRLAGNQGIRFEGRVNTEKFTATIKEYHILLAYGKEIDPTKIVEGATVNKQVVLDGKDEAGIDANGKYYITLFGIPAKYYDQPVTARAYVVLSDNSVVYAKTVTTRNLIDTAREAYSKSNDYDTGDNLVTQLVANKNVKVTNAAGEVSYRSSLEGLTIAKGDIIDIAKGTYATALNINVNDVTINGVYAGILPNGTTRTGEDFNEAWETTLTSKITIGNNVKNTVISGIRFNSDMALSLNGDNSEITLKYCKINYSSNAAIREYNSTGETSGVSSTNHSNINILKNTFNGTNSSYSRGLFLQGNIGNINIEGNTFESASKTAVVESENCIKINKFTSGAVVNINQNTFKQKYANYLVDLASKHTTSNYLNAYINIENNAGIGSSTGNEFFGNGFIITYIGTSSTINFIHNEKMRFSRYYNTILFSEKNCTGSKALGTTTQTPTIVIKYNKLYGDKDAKVENPGRDTTLSTNYLNMGLGFGATINTITITQNYFSGSARGYSFTELTSTASSKNVYASGAITNATRLTDGYEEADSLYNTYCATSETLFTELKSYNEFLTGLSANVEAYSGGSNEKNIINYIPTFDATKYANKLEIQNGKLVYIGTDAQEQLTAARISIFKASSVKPAQ